MRKIHVEHTIPAPKHAFIIWNCLDFFFTTIIHSQVKMVHCTRHPPPQPTLSVSLASKVRRERTPEGFRKTGWALMPSFLGRREAFPRKTLWGVTGH